jgi:hypothetical protein
MMNFNDYTVTIPFEHAGLLEVLGSATHLSWFDNDVEVKNYVAIQLTEGYLEIQLSAPESGDWYGLADVSFHDLTAPEIAPEIINGSFTTWYVVDASGCEGVDSEYCTSTLKPAETSIPELTEEDKADCGLSSKEEYSESDTVQCPVGRETDPRCFE